MFIDICSSVKEVQCFEICANNSLFFTDAINCSDNIYLLLGSVILYNIVKYRYGSEFFRLFLCHLIKGRPSFAFRKHCTRKEIIQNIWLLVAGRNDSFKFPQHMAWVQNKLQLLHTKYSLQC